MDLPDGPARNRAGRFTAHPAQAARDSRAAQMYAQGYRLREIRVAEKFGSDGAVHDAITRAMRAVRAEGGAVARAKALARLDEMYARAREVLNAEHLVVQQGVVVHRDGEPIYNERGKLTGYAGGEPLIDYAPVLNSLRLMLQLEERRAKIEGTDAPTKARVEVSHVDEFDSRLRGLLEEMERRDAGARPGGGPAVA